MTTSPTFGLPSPQLPATDPKTGMLANIWYQFFARAVQLTPERPLQTLAVGPSPFVYTAYTIGHLLVNGGSVAGINLTRDGVSVACPTTGFIPMAANDIVTIAYLSAPLVTFVPSARA